LNKEAEYFFKKKVAHFGLESEVEIIVITTTVKLSFFFSYLFVSLEE
jgi:hypothetical protein